MRGAVCTHQFIHAISFSLTLIWIANERGRNTHVSQQWMAVRMMTDHYPKYCGIRILTKGSEEVGCYAEDWGSISSTLMPISHGFLQYGGGRRSIERRKMKGNANNQRPNILCLQDSRILMGSEEVGCCAEDYGSISNVLTPIFHVILQYVGIKKAEQAIRQSKRKKALLRCIINVVLSRAMKKNRKNKSVQQRWLTVSVNN